LAQPGAVAVDLVEEVVFSATFAVTEENSLSVVVDLGIADAAPRIGQQGGEFASNRVPAIELGAFAPSFAVRIVRVVTDVGVPVPVRFICLASTENELLRCL